MAVEVKVPQLGESVTEAIVANWMKKPGEAVAADEAICELETDKVTLEVNAPVAGALSEIVAEAGAEVEVGALLALIEEGAAGSESAPEAAEKPAEAPKEEKAEAAPPPPPPASKPAPAPAAKANLDYPLPPAVRKLVEDNALDPSQIPASGKGGRLTKADVVAFMQGGGKAAPRAAAPSAAPARPGFTPAEELPPRPEHPLEERVKMTKLRRVIASRLKEAQNTAALLTTWNDVDMTRAMEMRAKYKDAFEKKHGVRLGFMSMFVRAACIALKEWPAVNGEIYGDEIIYKNYYNIGVAVGTPNGLVVPVLKDADEMSFAGIEGSISDFGRRARDGKLSMDEMTGGTFTISNGGVFGSMNSMPIINVPQSAIMGMHRIEKRPVAVGDEVQIRPMMYLALSYDHRIIDGREAVSFLVRIKQCIEDPSRILLDV
jgi:2-oxoglutarate dehydrogenase E2 component (dihydrolipoamide succinyltransferase)